MMNCGNGKHHVRHWPCVLAAGCALAMSGSVFATTWTVTAAGTSFTPASITVAPGDTIHWVRSNGTHTVTSGTGCSHNTTYFNSPLDATHPTFDWVVPTGVPSVPYFCQPHCAFGMTGTITVQSTAIQSFTITLDGNQEVPAVTTTGSGTGTATLDTQTGLFSWNISYSGLSSAETAAHFHGAATACNNAGVQITLPSGSPKVGSAALTAQQIADVLAGNWYVNVHTSTNPGGEIRGQVMPSALANPIPATIPPGNVAVQLRTVATGLTAPVWGTPLPGQPDKLIVADQAGTLWSIDLAAGSKSVFLDVTARLVALGIFGPNTFDERGFLGVAFDPDYLTNGLLYTYTSEPVNGAADFSTIPAGFTANCQNVLAEWHVPNPTAPSSVVDPLSRREVVRIDKPQFNHNGGGLNFGPDGYLYLSTGDGGSGDDRDGQLIFGAPTIGHGCGGNGQNTGVILGKIVRIDPHGNNSANGKYGIPPTNPFVGGGGLPEIWAYGLRNPWRYSFDSATGTLYCADVGQNSVEELDIITPGGNYGWRAKEGSFYFVFNGDQPGYVTDVPLSVSAGLIDPIAQYDHDEGLAIVGGFVYRGTRLPALQGKYVFGDFARTFSNDGRLFYLDSGNQIKEFQLIGQDALGLSLLGFAQDAVGELYVLASANGVPFGTTGVVLQIAPATCAGDCDCDGRVGFSDIDYFVAAIPDNLAGWAALYEARHGGNPPPCGFENVDITGDGHVNFADIDPFVALIPSTCP